MYHLLIFRCHKCQWLVTIAHSRLIRLSLHFQQYLNARINVVYSCYHFITNFQLLITMSSLTTGIYRWLGLMLLTSQLFTMWLQHSLTPSLSLQVIQLLMPINDSSNKCLKPKERKVNHAKLLIHTKKKKKHKPKNKISQESI